MLENYKNALVLAPHTDDGEFGCGATISKLIELGCEVTYVAFSSCQESVREDLPKDILKKEVKDATSFLGIKSDNCIVLDFRVRKFPEARQEILEKMIKMRNELNPDLVFLPSSYDTHQDHKTISDEGFRAYKNSTIFGYEVPWNNKSILTNCFIEIDKSHLDAKCGSLKQYKSQDHRSYAQTEFIHALAKVRGTQIGKKFAECFELIRLIA